MRRALLTILAAAALLPACGAEPEPSQPEQSLATGQSALSSHAPNLQAFADLTGEVRTFSSNGAIDQTNPFFQNLGTNGRTCNSCHVASDGWTILPAHVQARFDATGGTDPIFRTNDGSVSPNADVSTVDARRKAFAMLLTKGLIRVGIGVPDNAEFSLVAVDDPYGYASASQLSLFRRPLPSTNLQFLSTVMWDGRETFPGQTIHYDLSDQANGATQGHAQGNPLTDAQREAIVDFETALFTAQGRDNAAGELDAQGGQGGAVNLSQQPFYIGINDPLGHNPTGAAFNPAAFTLFNAWGNLNGNDPLAATRAAVARGEALFNSKPITLTGVGGLNDDLGVATIQGTCTLCHDAPNVGDHSVPAPLNIGISDASRRTPDMPLYTFQNNATGETVQTTDPGRALITGKWKHIGRFKGPILRGLAARAPYFHNGSASSLADVVNFYDTRFGIGFTAQEKSDLVAFLQSL